MSVSDASRCEFDHIHIRCRPSKSVKLCDNENAPRVPAVGASMPGHQERSVQAIHTSFGFAKCTASEIRIRRCRYAREIWRLLAASVLLP